MPHRPLRLRATLVLAIGAGALAPALAAAAPLDTVVRIEGAAGTLVPESAIVVDDQGTETFFDTDSPTFASVTVPRASAFFQLQRATTAAAVPLAFDVYDANLVAGGPTPPFQAFITRVGPDAGAGALGWSFRVNGATPSAFAANQVDLRAGDRVLWFYGSGAERTLEVAASADVVARGAPFTVSVTSRDADGTPTPAAGARVAYGQVAATADAQGRATFVGQAPGVRAVQATRGGEIRSPSLAVCSFEGDPTACNLSPGPPAPAPAAGPAATAAPAVPAAAGTAGQAQADLVPPGSRITSPRPGRRQGVRALAGVAGPDRSDLRGVEVALAQRVGTLCRFRRADGRLDPPGPCRAPRFLPARSAGGAWLLGLRRDLAPGLWRVWSRATDGAGNRESVGIAGVNTLQFRVVPTAR